LNPPTATSAGEEPLEPGGKREADPETNPDWAQHPMGPPARWPRSLRTLLATIRPSPQPMWIAWGPELHVFCNPAYASLLGRPEADIWGAPAAAVWPGIWATLGPRLESVRGTGTGAREEGLNHAPARQGTPEESFQTLSLSPVPDDCGAIGGVLAIASETSHRVLAEANYAKTAFLSHVSRELREPLSLVLSPVDDLLRAPPPMLAPEARDLIAVAHRNSLRLLKLVNALVDYAQIEAGRMRAEFKATDLAQFTTELASSFRATIERTGVTFVVDCPPLPEPIHIDRELWEKIVLNLVSNAFKFTLTGEIRVALRMVGDCAELTVRDTGAGIPAEARPYLFERFHRVAGMPARTAEGAGLGLALVRELVRLHGGTIHVDSEPGRGSTFTVFLRAGREHLPREPAVAPVRDRAPASLAAAFMTEAAGWDDGSPETDPPAPAPDGSQGQARGHVLVVDASAEMRRYMTRLLSERFDVAGAADGAAALALIQQRRPDLVVSDVMTPGLDGFGLLKAIRSRAELRTLPVILLSARAGEDSRIEGFDAGADDFLVKPFSARELLARVKVHLHLARLRSLAEERERELRTRAEGYASALKESTERLSASLTAAGTGTFRWDLRTDQLDFDAPLVRLTGLTREPGPIPLAEILALVHPDDRARAEAAGRAVVERGENLDLEFRVIQPSGAFRWLEGKGRTFFDDAGAVAYMTGALVDITKRKQAEVFVWRQRDVLEQIVQGAPLADVLETLTLDLEQVAERSLFAVVMMADRDGRRLRFAGGRRCPPAWRPVCDGLEIGLEGGSCGAAALRQERVIVRDVMTSPYWSRHRTDAIRLGLRACWSTPILSSRGTVLGTIAVYAPDPSAPTDAEIRFVDIVTRTAAIAFERDQTEAALQDSQAQLAEYAQTLEARVQERTARLQETISELESFSYSISHDMRAPLRAMQSFAQILAEDCGDRIGPEGKDYIRRIIGASDRMDRLIQDVLTYSRAARHEIELGPVDVGTLLDGILESYPHFQPPRARIEIQRPLERVIGNPAALTQCLANLVGNAIKFVAPGVTPHVVVWTEVHGDRVRLFVRDNGIGIELEAHEKIFHIFYQLDRSYEGTGIGLAVVRKAAERMGGRIGLTSNPGGGSTFHLDLARAS
jgi:PAS domain S-box-containing protein